jgi:hypothetical protein
LDWWIIGLRGWKIISHLADFQIGGALERRTACGFGNPRYSRLGSLRYVALGDGDKLLEKIAFYIPQEDDEPGFDGKIVRVKTATYCNSSDWPESRALKVWPRLVRARLKSHCSSSQPSSHERSHSFPTPLFLTTFLTPFNIDLPMINNL